MSLLAGGYDKSFYRLDLCVVGSNNKNTVIVLPPSKGKPGRLVAGSTAGSVTAFKFKKGVPSEEWKSVAKNMSAGVTALSIGGPPTKREFVFAAHGQNIRGLKKSGKEFCHFNTSLNENIQNMYIESQTIFCSCDYVVNSFDDFKENNFYMSPDKVNSFVEMKLKSNAPTYDLVLGCQDGYIRLLSGSDMLHQTRVSGPVNSVIHFDGELKPASDPTSNAAMGTTQIAFGTDGGEIGISCIDGHSLIDVHKLPNTAHRGAVSVMTSVDIMNNGVPDLMVGRDDGSLEVYSLDKEAEHGLTNKFTRNFSESIQALLHGFVLDGGKPNLILETYSGNIISLTPGESSGEQVQVRAAPEKKSTSFFDRFTGGGGEPAPAPVSVPGEQAIAVLTQDIQRLKEELSKKKAVYKESSREMVAVKSSFNIRQKMRLLVEESCYSFSVEIELPLDLVILQSDIPIVILSADDDDVVISHTATDEKDENRMLVTFRCNGSKRLGFKVRTEEVKSGNVTLHVIPQATPKSCHRANFHVKALSLHSQIDSKVALPLFEERELTTMSITGDFTLTQIHAWIAECFPDLPPRITTEKGELYFRNVFLGSIVSVVYTKGTATFQSDSVTTISILIDVITHAATYIRVVVHPSVEVNDKSVSGLMEMLRPVIESQFNLKYRHDLIAPLKELEAQNDDIEFLFPEYKKILANATELEKQFKESPRHLQYLRDFLVGLYTSKHKLKGRVPRDLPTLMAAMNPVNFQFEALLKIMCD